MGVLQLQTAEVFTPLLESHRYKGAKGGRGSGKSHNFADLAIDYCVSHPGLRMVCIREVQKSLKLSSKLTLEDKIHQYKLGSMFGTNSREIRTPGGGLIIFQGMQDHTAETIKSIEGFDVAWVAEAQSLSQRSLDLLRPTIRKTPRSVLRTPEIWFDWNPRFKTDPVDTFFLDGEPPPDSVLVTANYGDNPWFPEDLRAEMEWDKRRNPQKFAHIWGGGYQEIGDAAVFKNWRVEEFETPDDITIYWGADWGYSVDPTVLIGCWIDHTKRRLHVAFEAYKIGCEIDHIPELFDGVDPDRPERAREWPITADSQRPDTISFVRRNGYPAIRSAKKGPGSVEDGIEFLQSYDIIVHPRCTHTIDELTYYAWKTDKHSGLIVPLLEDKKNHVIDSLRYSIEAVRRAVRGEAASHGSEVSARYDGQVVTPRAVPRDHFPDPDESIVGVAEIVAFEDVAYDGGLT